jgi:nucleotide-binding universal stress UspA family protein
MTMKSILAPLRGAACDSVTLDTALLAAKAFGSHIECLYVRLDPRDLMLRTAAVGMGMPVISPELWTALEDEEKSRHGLARKTFDAFCTSNGICAAEAQPVPGAVTATWHETSGDAADGVVHFGRTSDAIVLSREPAGSVDFFGNVVMQCGKPVIVAADPVPSALASTVAIAWKETAEAARAITAALPLLKKATKVVIISADEGGSGAKAAASTSRLVAALRRNGIEAQVRHLARTPDVQGDILNAALEEHADLLVMGAYSHSRARELILGGLTRRVLQEAKLPVLLCH